MVGKRFPLFENTSKKETWARQVSFLAHQIKNSWTNHFIGDPGTTFKMVELKQTSLTAENFEFCGKNFRRKSHEAHVNRRFHVFRLLNSGSTRFGYC